MHLRYKIDHVSPSHGRNVGAWMANPSLESRDSRLLCAALFFCSLSSRGDPSSSGELSRLSLIESIGRCSGVFER